MKRSSFFKKPKPIDPPKPVKPYAPLLGRILATVSIVFALVHLIRIDSLVQIVGDGLASSALVASLVVIFTLLAEVFAVPFLLRMKLSPLAHLVSGFQAVFAPLMWLLISIWLLGTPYSTGQLGQFVATPSSVPLVLANLAWLSLAFVTLWALGYNRLSMVSKKKK